MPLSSPPKEVQHCVVKSKTGIPCQNPPAYGCRSCEKHGAHKSRNVLKGTNHPQYKHGRQTAAAKAERKVNSLRLRHLINLGNQINLFGRELKITGRPPSNYVKLDTCNDD